MSVTRWSARIDCVLSFGKNLNSLKTALSLLTELNLTAKTKSDIAGLQKYMSKFKCLLLASIWLKILIPINKRNLVLQHRDTTIDVERDNIDGLVKDLLKLRESWDKLYDECELVAQAIGISCSSQTGNDASNNNNDQTAQVRNRKLTEKMKTYKHPQTAVVETVLIVKSAKDEVRDGIFYTIIDSVVTGLFCCSVKSLQQILLSVEVSPRKL